MDHDALVALLAGRGAASLAHPGGTLLAHVQRTQARLEAWGADRALTVAGLCHAAYGTQGFPAALFQLREREVLRSQIGDEAEAIVYAYCALDRAHARDSTSELRDRFSGEYWQPSTLLQQRLAELTVANELDVAAHADLAPAPLRELFDGLWSLAAHLSQAACSALATASRAADLPMPAAAPSRDREIAYRELGNDGKRVLFWHGGAAPELTWSKQHALADESRLRIPWRRGFAPSVAAARQDWEADVRDLLRVACEPAHVVAHSYGGVSAMLAAARAPERFASLVVIEAPLYVVAPDDPELQRFIELSRAFASGAPEARAAFLAIAGMPLGHEQTARTERLARDFRDPSDATFDCERLRRAELPIAIVSGAHTGAIERLSDALARELAAERWILPGAGHAVQRVPSFNDRLRAFLRQR